jgi:phenylalanyl-tRNA synthetase alpha subunit
MTTPSSPSIAEVERDARERLAAASDEAALEAWRTGVLGRSGTLTGLLRGIGALPAEERAAAGAALNVLRQDLEAALKRRRDALASAAADAVDVTLVLPTGRRRGQACSDGQQRPAIWAVEFRPERVVV